MSNTGQLWACIRPEVTSAERLDITQYTTVNPNLDACSEGSMKPTPDSVPTVSMVNPRMDDASLTGHVPCARAQMHKEVRYEQYRLRKRELSAQKEHWGSRNEPATWVDAFAASNVDTHYVY